MNGSKIWETNVSEELMKALSLVEKIAVFMIVAFVLSLAALVAVDVLIEIKTYHELAAMIFDVLIMAISISVFVLILSRTKSILKASAISLILPLYIFGYPALTDYLDMYHAKRDPNSFYFEG